MDKVGAIGMLVEKFSLGGGGQNVGADLDQFT